MNSYIIEGRKYAARSMEAAKLSHKRWQERTLAATTSGFRTAVQFPNGGDLVTVDSDTAQEALTHAANFIENGVADGLDGYRVTVVNYTGHQSLLNHKIGA